MIYLIDGYNLLFSIYNPSPSEIDTTLTELVSLCKTAHLLQKARTIIVFDGKEKIAPAFLSMENFQIIFTEEGHSADDFIIEYLYSIKNTQLAIVISSDNLLAKRSKELGARVKSCQDFFRQITQKRRKIETKPSYIESDKEFKRLKKIFEDKLRN